jgi:hypothetical protein
VPVSPGPGRVAHPVAAARPHPRRPAASRGPATEQRLPHQVSHAERAARRRGGPLYEVAPGSDVLLGTGAYAHVHLMPCCGLGPRYELDRQPHPDWRWERSGAASGDRRVGTRPVGQCDRGAPRRVDDRILGSRVAPQRGHSCRRPNQTRRRLPADGVGMDVANVSAAEHEMGNRACCRAPLASLQARDAVVDDCRNPSAFCADERVG